MLDQIEKLTTWFLAIISAIVGATAAWVTNSTRIANLEHVLDDHLKRANPLMEEFIVLKEIVRLQNEVAIRDREEIIGELKALHTKVDGVTSALMTLGADRRKSDRRDQ